MKFSLLKITKNSVTALILFISFMLTILKTIFFPTPMVKFDAANLTGEVTSGASGFLYGLAEDGIPSKNMTDSIAVSSVSAKTQGGLQHPIGEVGDVAPQLLSSDSCDYVVVYLQDMYSTWYYDHENITQMKQNGSYDWKTYLQDSFFPMVKKTVMETEALGYGNKIVYCLYNECDNGIWFGDWTINENGDGYHDFNAVGQQNFYEGWRETYQYVKSLAPNALIGGPGYFEYSTWKLDAFLDYTTKNNCVPDVMIYHELQDRSVIDWQAHVEEFRDMLKKYNLSEKTPIIVTEYGRMQDNGDPNIMAKYITQIENTKVYANQAYWLLANNLCNTAADYNTPNSAWWVYRWYANMDGQTMQSEICDFRHSDYKLAWKQKRLPRYDQFMGLGVLSDNKDKIEILTSGADYKGDIKITHLDKTALQGKNVKIQIEAVNFQGLVGQVYAPETVKIYTETCGDTLTIPFEKMDKSTAYFITVTEAGIDENLNEDASNTLYRRFEFENGNLLGKAYTYDSAYATTGETAGMVGGMEQEGDGVELKIYIPEDGNYELKFIYGNSNDAPSEGANGRVNSLTNFTLDGKTEILSLPNTVKSELTSSYSVEKALKKGIHLLRFTHHTGTIVLDSVLVKNVKYIPQNVYISEESGRDGEYLLVAPQDGWYQLKTPTSMQFVLEGVKGETDENGMATVYLRRGLNVLKLAENHLTLTVSKTEGKASSLPMSLTCLADGANWENGYLDGISSEGGYAEFTVTAPKSGIYRLTIQYAANREKGVHDYNVDLVEDFVTLSVGGEKQQNLYCRNTYSWDTYTSVTTNIKLEAGENILKISNDGANQFNGFETFAPHIDAVEVNPVLLGE